MTNFEVSAAHGSAVEWWTDPARNAHTMALAGRRVNEIRDARGGRHVGTGMSCTWVRQTFDRRTFVLSIALAGRGSGRTGKEDYEPSVRSRTSTSRP
ncbi:hypothetical protein GS506_06085 [Rhodococcus hoagii]|nr:hypothetical protein [Prescottella equi]